VRYSRALVAVAILLGIVPVAGDAHIGPHSVNVRNNFFDPQQLRVDPGESVSWTALDDGHTVTADDGWFDLPGSGTLSQGQTVGWTAPATDVLVTYHCKVHAGMTGVVVVGDPPVPPPPPPPPIEVRAVPSEVYPTIASALAALPLRVRIEIEPGAYPEALTVHAPAPPAGAEPLIEIVGLGADPEEVQIVGAGMRNTGLAILAAGVRLENVTFADFTFANVYAQGVRGLRIERVHTTGARYGIRLLAPRGGRLSGVHVSGAGSAGLSIVGCDPCDLVVDDVDVRSSLAGVHAQNAGGLVIRHSTFRDNGVGIVLRSDPAEASRLQRGAHVFGNHIADNTATFAADPANGDLPVGAGVWIDGGWFDTIEQNSIEDHVYGVAVTGIRAPSVGDRILGNAFDGSRVADLAWDGIGAGVCLAANTRPDGTEPSSHPPAADVAYACGSPGTVGAPFPVVSAILLAQALGVGPP